VRLATGGISGRDLAVKWTETRVGVHATIERDGLTALVAAHARRIADLRLDERLRRARDELADRASATAPAPGVYTVVLRAPAHAHDGYGLWQALVAQADGALVRQGLSRYRVGSEIAPRAAQAEVPLDVLSDGTLPFGVLSAPAGDRGEPVRRFAVVERGIARGLSLDQREAALAQEEPNGGIRNLVIGAGTAPLAEVIAPAAGASLVDVDRFAWLDLDPRTGVAVARIAAGGIRDGSGRRPIAGGTLRLDAIAAIASARRSREQVLEGAVFGPVAMRLDGVAITE
jgi:predicted Zn-dependent protease